MIDDGRLPYFHCYPGKLLGALASMTPDQQLVYMTTLLRIYEVRGPNPDSLDALSRRIGINKRRISDALDALFRTEKLSRLAGGIMNPFAEKVLADGEALHRRLKSAGAAGGKTASEKRKEKQSGPYSPATSPAKAKLKHLNLKEESTLFPTGNNASSAEPPREDMRTALFDRGLETLRRMTGRTDNGCRTLLGKWLKIADDDAATLLTIVEDADHQRIANPVPWIERAIAARHGHGSFASNNSRFPTRNGFAELALQGLREDADARATGR